MDINEKITKIEKDVDDNITVFVSLDNVSIDFGRCNINFKTNADEIDENIKIVISNINPDDFLNFKKNLTKGEIIDVYVNYNQGKHYEYNFVCKYETGLPTALYLSLYDNPVMNENFFKYLNGELFNYKKKNNLL